MSFGLAGAIGQAALAAEAVPIAAVPVPRVVTGADLARCLELADRNHPNLLVARAKVAHTKARLLEAEAAPFSRFRATGGMALAPTVLGSSVFSPNTDASLGSSLGVAWRVGVEGALPLFTFGKLTSLWDAAEAGVEVQERELDMTRDEVRLEVRRAYFGLQLARDALDLIGDAKAKVDEAVRKLEREVEEADADPIDLLKLQTYVAGIDAREAEAEKYLATAEAGLRFYSGEPALVLRDEPLSMPDHELGTVSRYLRAARVYRPEVLMAKAGLLAREAQLNLARAQLYPDIGLGLSFGLSAAPEIADQINPFVSDGGNYVHYSAALVFQWQLDFLPSYARIKQAEAQLAEVIALDRKALGGVAAQVEEAFAEAKHWKKRFDAYLKAERYARRWLATVQQAIDIGTMEERDLIDPAKAYAEQRYNTLNATMEYRLALAKLAKATGWDAVAK
ncbi:MAG: TolC family protein [Myxococcales bacterium]|nr:TolC family protein [Myxococcales bacterium]